MRRGVHGVDVARGRRRACAAATMPGEVGHGAHRVGRGGHRDPARAVAAARASTALGGQLERVAVGLGEAHRRARALGRDHPRAHVGVVVQAGADDLVAGPQGARRRWPAKRIVSVGHARAEDHATRVGAEQRRRRRARACATSSSVALRGRERRRPGWRCRPSASSRPSPRSRVSTICVPAGPSRRAQPSSSPGKRSRFIRSAPPHAGRSRPCASPRGPARRPTGWRG